MESPKISFFVDDLAGNAIVRAAPLAEALRQDGFRIEVIGFLISGSDVYRPYRNLFDFKVIHLRDRLRGHLVNLGRLATGDIIYACKPLPSTLLPAMLTTRFGTRKPVLLDVEDNELWVQGHDRAVGFRCGYMWLRKLWLKRRTYGVQPLARLATGVTVVSSFLQRRYGGTIVLHGPDESVFNPSRADLDATLCRQKLGLPQGVPIVVFAGIPHPHKGFTTIIRALSDPRLAHVHLALAGNPQIPEFNEARSRLGKRAIMLGLLGNSEMPALLAAVDIVAVPQIRNGFTAAQIPAKLLEGMAMAKNIVGSRVSDIPRIIGEGALQPRGWLHEPGSSDGLARSICNIIWAPDQARQRANAARQYFIEEASISAIRRRLRPIVEQALRKSLVGP